MLKTLNQIAFLTVKLAVELCLTYSHGFVKKYEIKDRKKKHNNNKCRKYYSSDTLLRFTLSIRELVIKLDLESLSEPKAF